MVDFLVSQGIKLRRVPSWPDYYDDRPGGCVPGRTVIADQIIPGITGGALDSEEGTPGPILLQGDKGFSRKGPKPEQASWYYSQPHLAVSGAVTITASGPRARTAASVGRSCWATGTSSLISGSV